MGEVIKLKRSSTAAAVPTAAQLEYGELALNVADGKIFFRKSDDTIAALDAGTRPPATAGVFNLFTQAGASDILFIGDSNAAGAGQAAFTAGFMARVARSIMNNFDRYPSSDRGYMYYTWLNAYQQLAGEPGWSHGGGGSSVEGGPGGNAWRLPAGAWIERTGVEVTQAKAFYAPSSDGSTVYISVNGDTYGGFEVNSSGMSGGTALSLDGSYIAPTDTVRFTCVSGSVDIYGVRLLRKGGSSGPLVYCSPAGSTSFSDYAETSRSKLLTDYLKADQPSAPKLIVCLLGTNNMIASSGKQKIPSEMVEDMQAFVDRYRLLVPDCAILFWVPPRPRADVLLPLGTYDEYASAIVEFVKTQSMVGLIRMDLSGLEGYDYYTDPDPIGATGVHFNTYMHAATAKVICAQLGIATDTAEPGFA